MRSAVFVSLVIFTWFAVGANAEAQRPEDSPWERPLETCWTFDAPAMSSVPLASDNVSTVFLPQTPARIIALSLLSGDTFWTVETSGSIISPPLPNGSKVVVYSTVLNEDGSSSYRSAAIDSLSGVSLSGFPLNGERVTDTEPFGTGLLMLIGTDVLRLADETGIRWERVFSEVGLSGISRSGPHVFAWSEKGHVILIDGDTGSAVLRFILPSIPSGAFAVRGEKMYAGSSAGTVFSVDRRDGEIGWSSRTGGTIDALEAEEDGVLAISRDNFVYFLADGNGSRIWKRRLSGRIIGSTKVGNTSHAFLAYGSNDVVVLNTLDGKPVNSYRIESADYFSGAPVYAGGYLLVPFDSGLAALAPKGLCKKKKDGQ
ncbi:MAG: PQQ-binding-like beta-propeller repeat protein [Acidobacteriota bacterium]|nr:MAG: PQQ-binding-like beta-propeller repeat protein [Acidobacteriota bacterium]